MITAKEARCLVALQTVGQRGATSLELTSMLPLDRVTVSPRLRPLERKGHIVDSGERRAGVSGRPSIVWRALP